MRILRVTIGTCVNGIMITSNSNNNYVFLNVFMLRIMSLTLIKINPQKEDFHRYDFFCLYGLKVSGPEIRHLPANHPTILYIYVFIH